MRVTDVKIVGSWQDVKDACMTTINKDGGKYPDSAWKKKLLLSEHSPIRLLKVCWKWVDLPYWVSVHFTRHKHGIEHWVSTQRTDRTGVDRDKLLQSAPVTHACEANAQALINISRKRLCGQAARETRAAWCALKSEIKKLDPQLAECMVPECVYRDFCPEMRSCGYYITGCFKKERERYVRV